MGLLGDVLACAGGHAKVVHPGEEALEQAAAWRPSRIIGIHIPVLATGAEAARHIAYGRDVEHRAGA